MSRPTEKAGIRQPVADPHDQELAAASRAAAEAGLSDREFRKLQFLEQRLRGWLVPLALVFFWVAILISNWYQIDVLARNGAEFGLSSPGEIWQLATSWQEQKRLFHPYEVLVVEKFNAAVWQAAVYFIATCFILASSHENRLALKLWRTLRGRL